MNTYENFLMSSASMMAASDEPEAFTMTAAETLAICIEEYAATGKYKEGCYNKVHRTISSCADLAAAKVLLEEGELLYIRNNFTEAEIKAETKKNGNIKFTKFLPGDYQSAKSVLLNALGKGMPLFNSEGKPVAKSKLSKALVESTKTDQQKLDAALSSVLRYARAVHGDSVTVCVDVMVNGSITDRAST